MIEATVAELASAPALNEIQRGYVLQLIAADAKGESGTIALLGAARKVSDCLATVLAEDAARAGAAPRLPGWSREAIAERVARPAVGAGTEILRKIAQAAQQGQPYFRFQGGLDVTRSTLSQTRRFALELVAAHPWPTAEGELTPAETIESLAREANAGLEALVRAAEEERARRWAALGPGRVP